jgi:hypothetical protein
MSNTPSCTHDTPTASPTSSKHHESPIGGKIRCRHRPSLPAKLRQHPRLLPEGLSHVPWIPFLPHVIFRRQTLRRSFFDLVHAPMDTPLTTSPTTSYKGPTTLLYTHYSAAIPDLPRSLQQFPLCRSTTYLSTARHHAPLRVPRPAASRHVVLKRPLELTTCRHHEDSCQWVRTPWQFQRRGLGVFSIGYPQIAADGEEETPAEARPAEEPPSHH